MWSKKRVAAASAVALVLIVGGSLGLASLFSSEYRSLAAVDAVIPLPTLDQNDYNARMLALAHYVVASTTVATSTNPSNPSAQATSSQAAPATVSLPYSTATTSVSVAGRPWPVAGVYPQVGAILPFKRIVAYYGNFYSKGMGVLGEYPEDQLLAKLASTTAEWAAADPTTPVLPAIQYIAVVAQGTAGKEGKYILRMPDDQIDHALDLAAKVNGIMILDVQVGQSTLEHELPLLEKYLILPQVHLAVDPEFSMKFGDAPGHVIGTFSAADVIYAATYLASIVDKYHLPPKVLVVHRFTYPMVTNYQEITPLPEVQVVMDMDGWGSQAKKKNTYLRVVTGEPVQFAGIKLFYKNDLKPPSTGLLTPLEVLSLMPAPIYIQYQ